MARTLDVDGVRVKSLNPWLWALSAIPAAVIVALVLFAQSANHPPPAAVSAEESSHPKVVAAAPGWVDVQGGTRHLSAKADGIVSTVPVFGDDPVPAGTVLLKLDDEALQLDQQAVALDIERQQQVEHSLGEQRRLARAEAERVKSLVDMAAEPADSLRQAQAQVASLDAAIKAAQLEASGARVKQQALALQKRQLVLVAPVRGRVLRIDVHEGESVTRGTPVIWFAPDAPLIVRAELDERLFAQVKVGMQAEVEAEGGDGRVYQTTLLSVARHVGPVRSLPEVRAAPADDRVVECMLALGESGLLIGQRVIVRIRAAK